MRNSGASAVVEGLGDHGCEYMTNGLVIVLGSTGRNFAAGMSGGLAFVLDETGKFGGYRCNKTSVDLEHVFDPLDQKLLQTWIYRHFDATESQRARYVLENFASLLPKFVKVYPHEYRKAMQKKVQSMSLAERFGPGPVAPVWGGEQVLHNG